MNNEEKKELIKFNIVREDSLDNSRLTWLLTFKYFAAYAVLETSDNGEKLTAITKLLPILGLVSAIVVLIVVFIGMYSVSVLHAMWIEIEPVERVTPFGLQKPRTGYLALLLGQVLFLHSHVR